MPESHVAEITAALVDWCKLNKYFYKVDKKIPHTVHSVVTLSTNSKYVFEDVSRIVRVFEVEKKMKLDKTQNNKTDMRYLPYQQFIFRRRCLISLFSPKLQKKLQ